MRSLVVSCLSVAVLAVANVASASSINFNFASGTGTGEQYGPLSCGFDNDCTNGPLNMTVSGVTASVTAWSIADNNGVESGHFSAAELGYYSIGLGVCNNYDDGGANCSSPNHQVDNYGGDDDFILINFGQSVTLNNVQLYTYDGSDGDGRNISYEVFSSAPNLSTLGTSGFTTTTSCPNGSVTCTNPDTVTLSGTGQYLLIGASLTDQSQTCQYFRGYPYDCTNTGDEFKIQDLNITPGTVQTQGVVPEPTSMALLGSGLLIGANRLRRRKK
jgi:hypothetical protein